MTKEILTHFSKTVWDYDSVASSVVFRNDELHQFLLDSITFEAEKNIKVLDIWSGTWHGMELILQKCKNCEIHGLDFSEKMTEKAEKKLEKYKNRIKFFKGDISHKDFKINRKYDLIISVFTIHNITHQEKQELFKKIYDSLNDWWIFINADFFQHEVKKLDEKMQDIYRKYLEENLKWEELQVWLNHAFKEDMPMKLSTQFEILENIWFKEVTLNWMFNNEAIYIANKL